MTFQLPDPILITPSGAITDLDVGLSLFGDDTISSIANVTITPSISELTVSNAALNANSVIIGGKTFAANQSVRYDLAFSGTVYGGAVAAYVDFTWTSAGGDTLTDTVEVELRRSLPARYSTTAAVELTGGSMDYTLIGVADGATTMGSFSGSTIQDDRSVKEALQDLETYAESTATDATSAVTKTNRLTVTQAVDLDTMESDVANLNTSKWWWDAEADLGLVPNDESEAASNTTRLQAYFTANASTRMPPLMFHQADYWVSGQLHNGNDAGYRSFFMMGAGGPEFASQHIEDAASIKRYTRIMIKGLADKSTPWLKLDGSTTVGDQPRGIKFKDIIFFIPTGHTGTVLDFGNYSTAGDSDSSTMRSVSIDNCYFSEQDHIANGTLGTAWLTDEGADGFVLNREQGDYLVRMSRVYDLSLKAGFRGSNGPQLWLANCDAPKVYSRHLLAWQAVRCAVTDNDHFLNDEGVPGMFQVYCETPMISGLFANAGTFDIRVETGYSEALTVNPIGIYDLPSGITWSAAQGSEYIQFANMGSRDVADYFEPGMTIRLTPVAGGEFSVTGSPTGSVFAISGGSATDDAYIGRAVTRASGTTFTATNTEHARLVTDYVGSTGTLTVTPAFSGMAATNKVRIADDHEYNLIVTEVDAVNDRVYFAQNTGTCTLQRFISGTGAECERLFGSAAVVTGERVEIQAGCMTANETYPGLPMIVAAPSKKNMIIRNSYTGSGPAPSDLSQYFQMSSFCRPRQYATGHVQFQGYQRWDHPYVINVAGIPFDANVSKPVYDEPEKRFPVFWKAGVHESAIQTNNDNLTLDTITDGDRDIWCVNLAEGPWILPFENPEAGTYHARVWSPQDYTSTWRFRFEASDDDRANWNGETVNANVASGWNTITWESSLAGITDVRLAQRDLWVAWVGMTPASQLKETVTTSAPALRPDIATEIDSSSNAVNATLGSGTHVGQIKTIVMTEASNSSTVSVDNHATSDPEVFTFDAVDEMLTLVWTGTEWETIKMTATAV